MYALQSTAHTTFSVRSNKCAAYSASKLACTRSISPVRSYVSFIFRCKYVFDPRATQTAIIAVRNYTTSTLSPSVRIRVLLSCCSSLVCVCVCCVCVQYKYPISYSLHRLRLRVSGCVCRLCFICRSNRVSKDCTIMSLAAQSALTAEQEEWTVLDGTRYTNTTHIVVCNIVRVCTTAAPTPHPHTPHHPHPFRRCVPCIGSIRLIARQARTAPIRNYTT